MDEGVISAETHWIYFKTIVIFLLYFLLLLALGIGMIFTYQKDFDLNLLIGGLALLFGAAFFFWGIVKITIERFTDPQKFAREQPQRYWKMIEGFHFMFIQDVTAIYIASKKLTLLLPFIASIFAIGVFTVFVLKANLISTILSIFPSNTPFFVTFFSLFYVYSFICMSIYMLGYLLTGEVLQRMFKKAKKNLLSDMAFDYVIALPFLLILTLLWVIFALTATRRREASLSITIWNSLKNLSFYALFEGFKYYTYINLARISFSDKAVGVHSKEARTLFSKNKIQLLKIFIRRGALLGIPLVIWMIVVSWNNKFLFLDQSIVSSIGIWLVVSMLLLMLFSEQLAILFYYVKTYYPENSFKQIGLELDLKYFPDNKLSLEEPIVS